MSLVKKRIAAPTLEASASAASGPVQARKRVRLMPTPPTQIKFQKKI